MYALRDSAPDDLDALREELSALGHSVVIVGDRAVAQVHVHLAEAGTAIEAGLGKGRLSQIRITALPPEEMGQSSRTVLSVVAGPGLAEAVSSLGGTPVLVPDRSELVGVLTAAAEQAHGDLVVLPNDMETLEIARHLATELRRHGRRVAVIPTVAQVQGLAAMAVHEPTADFDSVVVTMSSAAGHARHGAVTVAESSAMTMAGRCEAGDVLGAVEGDFTEIGNDAGEVAWRVVQRLLSTGGELVTVIAGAGAEPGSGRGPHPAGDGSRHRARRRGAGRRTVPLPDAAGSGVTTLRLAPSPWRTDTFRRLGERLERIVGAKTAKQFEPLRIWTVGDLMRHLPRRYFSGTELSDLSVLRDGEEVAVLAEVVEAKIFAATTAPPRSRGWRPRSPTAAATSS